MRFGKGLKKSKSQFGDVSDPGSEDSWDVLYKVNKSKSKNSVTSNHGRTSKAVREDTPVSIVKDQKNPVHGKNGIESGKIMPAHSNLRLRLDADKESEGSEKGPSLPVTSTPFVKRRQVPQFEVSAIISPVDIIPSNEHSETTLVLNRENPVQSTDEVFNKLVDSGNQHPKPSSSNPGVWPLKSVRTKADTTRQYAGGAVSAFKRNQCGNLTEGNNESGWETAEEKTASSSNKNSSNSGSEKRRSQKIIASSDKDERKNPAARRDVVLASREILQTVDEKLLKSSKDQNSLDQPVHMISNTASGCSNVGQSKGQSGTMSQPIKSSEVCSADVTHDTVNQKGVIHQEIEKPGSTSCDQDPSDCKNSTKDRANTIKPITCSSADIGNVNIDVLQQSDKNDGSSVVQKVHEKIGRPVEKNMLFCYNSNFAVKCGDNVILQSGTFGYGSKGNKLHAAFANNTQQLRDIRLNPIISIGDEEGSELHSQAKRTDIESKNSLPSMGLPCDRETHPKDMGDHINNDSPFEKEKQLLLAQSAQLQKNLQIDSSSEEEKKLLLAQSAQLRKNQRQSCRKLKSSRMIESKAQDAVVPICHKLNTDPNPNQGSYQVVHSPSPQPEDHLKKSKNELNSSCDSFIYVSRDPHDVYQSNDDDFQLEIMSSSSEEECHQMRKKHKINQIKTVKNSKNSQCQKYQESAVTSQSQKGGSLSFKAKEARRRRETLLKLRRHSSDSDCEESPSFLKKISKQVSGRQPKQRKQTPIDLIQNETEFCEPNDAALFEFESDDASEGRCAKSPLKSLTEEPRRNLNFQQQGKNVSPYKRLTKKLKQDPQTNVKLKPTNVNFCQSLGETSISTSRNVDVITPTKRQRSEKSCGLASTVEGLKRPISTDLDQGPLGLPKKVSRRKENIGSKPAKKRFNICLEDGIRHSSRMRKAPAAYWLGHKASGRISENDLENINDETTTPVHTVEADAVIQTKKAKQNQKREIYKHDDPVKVQVVAKQSKKELKSIDCQSNPKEVLQYERDLAQLSYACKMNESKKVECVWDSQIGGDIIYLGKGADYTNHNQLMSNTERMVFYVLKGNICYQLSQNKKNFSSGCFFIIPQGESYHVKNIGNSTAKLVKVSCKV